MFYSRRRQRRAKSAKNATWVPYSAFFYDKSPQLGGSFQIIGPGGYSGTPQQMVGINPWYAAQDDITTTGDSGEEVIQATSMLRPASPKLMKFDGKIWIAMQINRYGTSDSDQGIARPLLVVYQWRMLQITPEASTFLANTFDMITSTASDSEKWEAMSQRGPGALLKWGQFWMQRETRNSVGRLLQGTSGSPNFQPAPSNFDQEWAEKLSYASIPFPRVPRTGFLMPKNRVLALFVQAVSFTQQSSEFDPLHATSMAQCQQLQVLPFFRYMLSWDDK